MVNNRTLLETELCDLHLKTPITTASGTFGFGLEFTDFLDLNNVGAITVKGTTLHPGPATMDSALLRPLRVSLTV